MESHLDPNKIADLTAELNLERLRSRTASVVAASSRLLEEVERSVSDLEGQHIHHQSRLRPERDPVGSHQSGQETPTVPTPTLGRSGIPEALKSIFQSAERLQIELGRIREGLDRNIDLLRGTDLGYDAREASTLSGKFAEQLLAVTEDYELVSNYDASQLRALGDALRTAIEGLGGGPSPSSLRRLRGGSANSLPEAPR